ncbi:lamin tail domain-containing protein [Phycisphaeraceae bacterium D3-23]
MFFSAPSQRSAYAARRRPATPSGQPVPLESLEPRLLFTAVPIITEFLASNDTVLDDEDGNSSDWIEIYNAGDTALDLDGWHLTDDADELTHWTFPAVSVAPGEYLVVFASNKDRADADGTELHTNFALSAGGEYLALVEADGTTIAYEYAPEYPAQNTDVSYGIAVDRDETVLIEEGADARYIVPTGPIAGWNTVGFNDSGWTLGPTGIGYENSPADYDALIESTVPQGTTSTYLRQTFNVADPSAIDELELRVRYDDGFVAYLNGTLVMSQNAPGSPVYNSAATGNHDDGEAVDFVGFDISAFTGALQTGTNVLAIQALNRPSNSDMLIEARLLAIEVGEEAVQGFMTTPTPGTANIITGPIIESVTQDPPQPTASQSLVIEAAVSENAGNGIDRVDLYYRVNFGSESFLQIFDNGLGSDAAAGDGIFTGVISSGLYAAGDMVRWYVTAEDTLGTVSRAPTFVDQDGNNQSAEYFGTVVADPGLGTTLPVFQWFTQDESASHNRNGTRASVYYNGRFYDNIFVRQRGGFTNAAVSQKFDFNKGEKLYISEELGSVGEINLNGNGADSSFLRQPMGFGAFAAAGNASSASFTTYMSLNGSFDRVGIWVEQPDEDYLERHGYDPDGDLYKFVQRGNLNPGLSDTTQGIEKKTNDENDLSSAEHLVAGLALPSEAERQAFIRDFLDIPQIINYLAARTLIQGADDVRKNFYLYVDNTPDGDGLWRIFPWDLDFTFNIPGGHDNQDSERTEHPFFGVEEFPTADGANQWNVMYDVLLETTEIQEMYLRRVRTLMDELYNGASGGATWFANYVNTNFPDIDPHLGSGATNGKNGLLSDIEDRRDELYVTYSNNIPGYSVVIPGAQPANPALSIGTIEHTPFGDQDQEYIQVINPNAFAVDLTGWTVEGAITHTFAPGTVVAAGATLYITPSSSAFRARATGPSGGQGLFVQQWDSGHLSSFGETVTIKRANGTTAASKAYVGDPSPEQEHLRIVELHYNPTGPTPAEQLAGFTDGDQFEFIELINTSATQTLDLAGVSIDTGLGDALFVGTSTTLASATFNGGQGGFTFGENTFNNTGESGVASGLQDVTGGNGGGGALRVDLASADGGPDHGPSSGAFSRSFTVDSAGPVTLSFDFRFLYDGGFEASEIGQAIAELDGVRLGSDVDGSLKSYTGDGNNGPASDTGWQNFSITLDLDAGVHTLSLGAYYLRSTFDDEGVTAWFDNLAVTAAGPVPLAPGQRALLVADLAAFTQRYGQQVVDSVDAIAQYTGNLANGGESLKLNDANGSTILDFAYEDGTGPGEADWPTSPDGDGPSLVVNDTEADYSDGNNWRASLTNHGTPGSDEAAGVLGDITGDGFVGAADLDALLALWGDAAASSPEAANADLDNSGTVGSGDLNIVINNFGNGTTPNNPTSNGNIVDDNDNDNVGNDTPGNPGSSADADADAGNNNGAGNETPFPSQRPRPDQPTPQPEPQPEPATPPATPPATRHANANAADRPNANIHANANTPLTPAQQQAANAQRTPSVLDLVKPKPTDQTPQPAAATPPPKPRFNAMALR